MNTILVGTGWTQSFAIAIIGVFVMTSIVVAITRLIKDRPILRHAILLSALLTCLMVPIASGVCWLADSAVVSIPVNLSGETQAINNQLPSADNGLVTEALSGPDSTLPKSIANDSVMASSLANDNSNAAVISQSLPEPPVVSSPWQLHQILLGFWLSATLFLVAFSIRGYWLGRRLVRQAHRVDLDASEVDAAAKHVGLLAAPLIYCSDRVSSPVVHGFLRPAVILPSYILNELPSDQLKDVLIHEFAHVHRRDTQILLLETLARCLYWPVITVHWLLKDLGNAREEICDNYVVSGRDEIRYAETLLGLAEYSRQQAS